MAKQYDFGQNQILRAEFLNALQDVLVSYLDQIYLTYSGATVIAVGTAERPIAISVAGLMRQIPVTLTVDPTGGAGAKGIFVVVRSDGIYFESYDSGDEPTVAVGEEFREVGTAEWDGANVTGVHTYAIRTNADFLQGRSTSFVPAAYAIPVSGDDGRLNKDWFAEVEAIQDPLGTIRRVWYDSSETLEIGSQWALMDGSVLAPGEHSFPGVATVVLPDMLNNMARGADSTLAPNTSASPVDGPGGAPGIGGVSGSNAPRDFGHDHTVSNHRHIRPAHEHGADHEHVQPRHAHRQQLKNETHVEAGVFSPRTNFLYTSRSVNTPSAPDETTSLSLATTHGNSANVVTFDGAGNTSTDLTDVDVRPAHVGLVHLVKVH